VNILTALFAKGRGFRPRPNPQYTLLVDKNCRWGKILIVRIFDDFRLNAIHHGDHAVRHPEINSKVNGVPANSFLCVKLFFN
jgi:hypothetical protein